MEYCARLAANQHQQDGSIRGYDDTKHLRVELGDQACQLASRPSVSRSNGLGPMTLYVFRLRQLPSALRRIKQVGAWIRPWCLLSLLAQGIDILESHPNIEG